MTRLSRATLEARLDLALAALKRAGEPVGGIEVARDGTVRILASERRREHDGGVLTGGSIIPPCV